MYSVFSLQYVKKHVKKLVLLGTLQVFCDGKSSSRGITASRKIFHNTFFGPAAFLKHGATHGELRRMDSKRVGFFKRIV